MNYKNNEITSLGDLLNVFKKIENCPQTREELVTLLINMKKAGLVESVIDGAYYIRSFIASNVETWTSINQYTTSQSELREKNEQEKTIKEKVELVHDYIKEEENWPKPEIIEEQSLSFDEFITLLSKMSEEEREELFSKLPEELLNKIKEELEKSLEDEIE
jgi:hypothetical protein